MKSKLLFLLIIASAYVTTNLKAQSLDKMKISIVPDVDATFVKRTFNDGVESFTNRKFPLINVPVDFRGFEFLTSPVNVTDKCTITSSGDGYIYLFSTNHKRPSIDWVPVVAPNFGYEEAEAKVKLLFIYKKQVIKGERISLPMRFSWGGWIPLAKTIEIGS